MSDLYRICPDCDGTHERLTSCGSFDFCNNEPPCVVPAAVDDLDIEAAAKALYKEYEGCSDEYVEKVWRLAGTTDDWDDSFAKTVAEMRRWVGVASRAALGNQR